MAPGTGAGVIRSQRTMNQGHTRNYAGYGLVRYPMIQNGPPALICYNKVVTVVANEKNIRKEVGNMTQNYTPEFRKKIVRLHEEEGRTYKSITAEYGVSKASICKWCSELRKECQTSEQAKADYNSMKENLRLKRENEELRKENAFLKKAAAFFAKEIG